MSEVIGDSQKSIAELTVLVNELMAHTSDLKTEIARLIEIMLEEQNARRTR